MSPEYQHCIQAHYTPEPHLQILSKDPCLPPDFTKPWQMWFCKFLVVFWLVFLLSLSLLLLFEYPFCLCLLCCDWFSTCLFNTLCGLRRGPWVAICNVSAESTTWNTIPTVPGNGIQARVTSSTVELWNSLDLLIFTGQCVTESIWDGWRCSKYSSDIKCYANAKTEKYTTKQMENVEECIVTYTTNQSTFFMSRLDNYFWSLLKRY